jgi:hypothetical protein
MVGTQHNNKKKMASDYGSHFFLKNKKVYEFHRLGSQFLRFFLDRFGQVLLAYTLLKRKTMA